MKKKYIYIYLLSHSKYLIPSPAVNLELVPYHSLCYDCSIPSQFNPPLLLMKCVEESGVGPALLNQKMERLF